MNKTCVFRNAIKCLKGKELAMKVQLLHVLSHSEMDWAPSFSSDPISRSYSLQMGRFFECMIRIHPGS